MPSTQIHRPFRIKTSLGADKLLLERFAGEERMSTPYRYTVRVLSEDAEVDMGALLTKPAVLTIGLDEEEHERHIHGNISRMKLMAQCEDGMSQYELEIVPWLWFLGHFYDSRIFQKKTVREIVEQVFEDRGFTDYRFNLHGTYPKRDYCVQYRETDLNFVSRLLEDEGIFYYFEQSAAKHTLVLADHAGAIAACPNKPSAHFAPSYGGPLAEDVVGALESEFQVTTGKVSLTDYDFEKPQTDLFASLETGARVGEYYEYPGGYTTKDEGDRYVRVRVDEREAPAAILRGRSNCLGLECGYKFKLEEHYRHSLNGHYTILSLRQKGSNTSYRAGSDQGYTYFNLFDAMPFSSDLLPRPERRTPKPIIHGTQTAVVVGKTGEEIFPDKYGRVLVQFHWDRLGTYDQDSSCWIRVAQGWAGKGWGSLFIPRIGQEVVVSFLEGDPDRPLITGSVYNADQTVPYALPDEMTKSTIKSNSSKGGEGFNEFRFEDKKGSEQVFLHAEKDIDIRAKHDRREFIGNDRNLSVIQDKVEKVGRDSHIHIVRDRIAKADRDDFLQVSGKSSVKITGSHTLDIHGDVIETFKGNHSSEVTQNLYIKGLQVVIEASTGLTLKVGPNFITIDPSGVAIKGLPMVQINSGGAALSGTPGTPVQPLTPKDPDEADKADPGSAAAAPSASPAPPARMTLDELEADRHQDELDRERLDR